MKAGLLKIVGLAVASVVFGLINGVRILAQPGANPIPVRVDQVDKQVVAAVKKEFPHGKIVGAEHSAPRPLDEGGSVYLTVKDGKKEFHVDVDCANGANQIETIWWEIAPSEVPGYVLDAVQSKHPRAMVKSAREIHNEVARGIHKISEPPSYRLGVKASDDEEIDILLSPVLKSKGDGGGFDAVPGKVRIDLERPVTEAGGKKL